MLKPFQLFFGLLLLSVLSGCMYYAEYEDKRAETEIKVQYKKLLEEHAKCLRNNANNYERCPQPAVPR